jgi:hypothetical protein
MMARLEVKLDARHERMMVRMDSKLEKIKAMRETCLGKTEACLESMEPTSLEIESGSELQEVPKEEATVKTVRALKKRHGDRHLDIKRRGQLKKRSQGNGGYRKKLAAAWRGMTRLSIPPQRKGQGQDNVARGAPKGQMFGMRRRTKPEGITGIRNEGPR